MTTRDAFVASPPPLSLACATCLLVAPEKTVNHVIFHCHAWWGRTQLPHNVIGGTRLDLMLMGSHGEAQSSSASYTAQQLEGPQGQAAYVYMPRRILTYGQGGSPSSGQRPHQADRDGFVLGLLCKLFQAPQWHKELVFSWLCCAPHTLGNESRITRVESMPALRLRSQTKSTSRRNCLQELRNHVAQLDGLREYNKKP